MKKITVLVLAICCFASLGFAQTNVNVDLTKLGSDARDQVLNSLKDGSETKISDYQKYAEIGKSIAIALGEAAKQLNVEVNAFASTPVGKITTYLIVYKIIGKDIIRMIGLLILLILLIFSFRNFFMKRKIKTSDGISYIARYEFNSSDARGLCGLAHVALFVIIVIGIVII